MLTPINMLHHKFKCSFYRKVMITKKTVVIFSKCKHLKLQLQKEFITTLKNANQFSGTGVAWWLTRHDLYPTQR